MIHGALNTEQLLSVTGYDRPADLCRSLEKQGIRYFKGKGGKPWTTLDLVNAAAGLAPANQAREPELLSPDDA